MGHVGIPHLEPGCEPALQLDSAQESGLGEAHARASTQLEFEAVDVSVDSNGVVGQKR